LWLKGEKSKMHKDIAIIGGSTSGLFTACLLAQRDADVRVYEASERIEPHPRTLIVTDYMRKVLGRLCDDLVINRIHRFELFADGRVGSVSLQRPDLIIERSRLTQRLAEHAEQRGAKILTGQSFLDLKPNGKRLHFTLSSNGNGNHVEHSAEVLVGADGVSSSVAKKAGWPPITTVYIVQTVVELPHDMLQDTTRVWFIPQETPYFYWLIPHSKTHGVLGLIGEDKARTLKALEGFLDTKGMVAGDYQEAMIPLYTGWIPNHRKLGNSDVYLVGDAAGHVKVSTVGGIVTGLRGAMGVAGAILNGGPNGELNALRRELNIHRIIRNIFNRFTQNEYIRLLEMLNRETKRTLASFHRDETTRLLLNLFLKQPRLLLLCLRAIVSGK
jgi:flavin-dependent dehydrogenase